MAVGSKNTSNKVLRVSAYVFCGLLAVLSLFPFVIMIVNSTRSTYQIQQHAVSLIPSHSLRANLEVLRDNGSFDVLRGFRNSFIISAGTTISVLLPVYLVIVTPPDTVLYSKSPYASYASDSSAGSSAGSSIDSGSGSAVSDTSSVIGSSEVSS